MSYYRKLCLVLSVLALVSFGSSAMAADLSGKKVVVVSGINKDKIDATGYYMYYEGINEVFKEVNITPVYQYAEMTYKVNDEEKKAAGDAAIAKAKAEKPDLIVSLDDDALKWIGARIDDIPVVFGAIYSSPKALGLPKPNVTGIMRASYAADIWKLTKKLVGVNTVGLLSKESLPMAGVKQYLAAGAPKLEAYSGVLFKDMIMCNTFEEWQKAVNTFPYDFIYLADTSRITRDGKELPREELTRWTVDNAKVPVIGASERDVAAGAMLSIVTSERALGQLVAQEAIGILKGDPVSQEYKQSKQGKLLFNAKTIQKYKVDVPYEIMSTAEKVFE